MEDGLLKDMLVLGLVLGGLAAVAAGVFVAVGLGWSLAITGGAALAVAYAVGNS